MEVGGPKELEGSGREVLRTGGKWEVGNKNWREVGGRS